MKTIKIKNKEIHLITDRVMPWCFGWWTQYVYPGNGSIMTIAIGPFTFHVISN